jgi:hypothetical protein
MQCERVPFKYRAFLFVDWGLLRFPIMLGFYERRIGMIVRRKAE